MPTSSPLIITPLIVKIMEIKPKTILDMGTGFGKYGVLCREYLEVWNKRYDRNDWEIKIDGIEVFKKYLTPIHHYVYDTVVTSDIRSIVKLKDYDLVLLFDVIEHLNKEEALELIRNLRKKAKKILISTPNGFMLQESWFGNEYERHKCGFKEEDFKEFNANVIQITDMLLIEIDGEKNEKKIKKNNDLLS